MGCALQSVLSAEQYWCADMRGEPSTLKLLKVIGELAISEGGEDAFFGRSTPNFVLYLFEGAFPLGFTLLGAGKEQK